MTTTHLSLPDALPFRLLKVAPSIHILLEIYEFVFGSCEIFEVECIDDLDTVALCQEIFCPFELAEEVVVSVLEAYAHLS